MTRGDIMDMSSFSLSFKSAENGSAHHELSSILDKMSSTGQQLLSELESAKEEAKNHSSLLLESLTEESAPHHLSQLSHEPTNVREFKTRCEKLEDVVLYLSQENSNLNRIQREGNKLCSKCRNLIPKSAQIEAKSQENHNQDCENCRIRIMLVMEKAAELQVQNEEHVLRIRKLEERVTVQNHRAEIDNTYKQRMEDLHQQLLAKETEIESLKDALLKDALEQNKMTTSLRKKDICSRKEVLLLCEKYDTLKKSSQKTERELYELRRCKQESTAKIRDLERKLERLKKKESLKTDFTEELKPKPWIPLYDQQPELSPIAHRLSNRSVSYSGTENSYGSCTSLPPQNRRPKSILKRSSRSSHVRDSDSTSFTHKEDRREPNPIIINEKRSIVSKERYRKLPHKSTREIVDVLPKKCDFSRSSDSFDISVSSSSITENLHHQEAKKQLQDPIKGSSTTDDSGAEISSPSSGTSEHIGRYEFLQDIDHLHAKGRSPTHSDVGLSARQQEYADKLVKKYTSGLQRKSFLDSS